MGHRVLFVELESFSGKDNRIYIGSGIIWSLSLEFQLGVREFHFDFWPIFGTSSNMFLSHQSCDSTTELLDPSNHPKHFVLGGSHPQPSAGIHTKVAQVVALSLGCPLDVIRVADTNSEALRPMKRCEVGLVHAVFYCFFYVAPQHFLKNGVDLHGCFGMMPQSWGRTAPNFLNTTQSTRSSLFFEFPKSLTRWCQMHDSLVDPLPRKSFAKQQDRCGNEILGGRLPNAVFWGEMP